MKQKKICHLKEDGTLKNDREKHVELALKNGGRIVSYHPFKSMQIITFDLRSPEVPDLWRLGFRKCDEGRYLRTILCRRGSCDFTVNGVTSKLSSGQVMMDYGIGDDGSFTFTSGDFLGVEITMQVEPLVSESTLLKMLRLVVESMHLPEEEIFDSDGYVFSYSKPTEQTLDKLIAAGLNSSQGILTITLTVEIGHNLGTDLKKKSSNKLKEPNDKQRLVADDIYNCLTLDYGSKHTAAMFAEKYGVSDTTVKNYFRSVYGYGFKEYQTKVRMERAASMITGTNRKISEISFDVGYPNQTKFTKAFKNYYHITPLKYRQSVRQNDNSEE